MLEEKKAQGCKRQQPGGFSRPKAPKINNRRQNLAASKNDQLQRSSGALDPAGRCALLVEHGASSPAAQPLTSPLFGRFPGSSLLIGQQVASLQLAQIKAQLTLTQISNAFAVGRGAPNLTGNCNLPAPYFAAKPPSPTAAAISLLNLLKIANSMSCPLNNTYASGSQIPTQMQLELTNPKTERDPWRATPCWGSGFNHESPGTYPGTPLVSPMLPQYTSDLPGQRTFAHDDDIKKSVDIHLSSARDVVGLISKTTPQTDGHPTDQGIHLTEAQRQKFLPSGTGMTSYSSSSSAPLEQSRQLGDETGCSSLGYYNKPISDESAFYSSHGSSRSANGAAAYSFNGSTESECIKPFIPCLGESGYALSDGPTTSKEPSQPKFTSQSAAGILWRFGLEKEDLEQLGNFPEDQITPENLPYILRQICKQKQRKRITAAESRRYPASGSGEVGVLQQAVASTNHQQSLDHGHSSKYTGRTAYEVVEMTKTTGSGGILKDTGTNRGHSQEPLPQYSAQVKYSTSSPPRRREKSPFTTLSASWGSILGSTASSNHDPTKQPPRPDEFSLPPHSAKSTAARDLEPKHQASSLKSRTFTPIAGAHGSQPGLEATGYGSGTKDQRTSPASESMVGVQVKQQQKEQLQTQRMPEQQALQLKMSNPLCSATETPAWRDTAVAKSSRVLQPATVNPAELHSLVNCSAMSRLPSIRQPAAKIAIFKDLPSLAMMSDYAAASPSVFPHTCSLCNHKVADIQDWISHQNSSRHLQQCKLLRQQYPEWDGEIPEESRQVKPVAEDHKQPADSKCSKRRHKKAKPGSCSHSRSPCSRRHHERKRKKRKRSRSKSPMKSRLRSPHSTRHTYRSQSHSQSPLHDCPAAAAASSASSSASSSYRHHHSRSGSVERRSAGSETRSSIVERVAEKLLDTSAVQSHSGLEDVVKTVASSKGGISPLPPRPTGRKLLPPAAAATSFSSYSSFKVKKQQWKTKHSIQKRQTYAHLSTKAGKCASLAPSMARLSGIRNSVSHSAVTDAMEHFGKTKSVVLFRSKQEALVYFESEEGARNLKSYKNINIQGSTVSVVRDDVRRFDPLLFS
ncbi:uncharacterized protein LOC143010611 [Genypterus blacodes]|uniref:uncharacterized protein LOC143010611 n=1 Tax=Genypterus blacodes TaxID=154954 RepID=UPI003F75ACF8